MRINPLRFIRKGADKMKYKIKRLCVNYRYISRTTSKTGMFLCSHQSIRTASKSIILPSDRHQPETTWTATRTTVVVKPTTSLVNTARAKNRDLLRQRFLHQIEGMETKVRTTLIRQDVTHVGYVYESVLTVKTCTVWQHGYNNPLPINWKRKIKRSPCDASKY